MCVTHEVLFFDRLVSRLLDAVSDEWSVVTTEWSVCEQRVVLTVLAPMTCLMSEPLQPLA